MTSCCASKLISSIDESNSHFIRDNAIVARKVKIPIVIGFVPFGVKTAVHCWGATMVLDERKEKGAFCRLWVAGAARSSKGCSIIFGCMYVRCSELVRSRVIYGE